MRKDEALNNIMKVFENGGDYRQTTNCVYCFGETETREHIPSKIFIDEPFPEDLQTIHACGKCNQGYSLDEEYVACLIECLKCGGTTPGLNHRQKIRSILDNKPALENKLRQVVAVNDESMSLKIESERISRILIKLARCHALFEQNEPQRDEPRSFKFGVLNTIPQDERDYFESILEIQKLPEAGSRSIRRLLIIGNRGFMPWVEVQEGRYRYLTGETGIVRIVIGEYLWCEVIWE